MQSPPTIPSSSLPKLGLQDGVGKPFEISSTWLFLSFQASVDIWRLKLRLDPTSGCVLMIGAQ